MKVWSIPDPVYRRDIRLVRSSHEELRTWILEFGDDGARVRDDELAEDNADAQTFYLGNSFVIWLPPEARMSQVRWISALVHEVTHLVHFVFFIVGIKLHETSTEAYAYYSEYLFSEMFKRLHAVRGR